MIKKFLFISCLFSTNQFINCNPDESAILTDSSDNTEYEINYSLSHYTPYSFDDEYVFPKTENRVTNYAYLRAYLCDNNIVTLCKQKDTDKINNLIEIITPSASRCGFDQYYILSCIDDICYDNSVEFPY